MNNIDYYNIAKVPKLLIFNWYIIIPALLMFVHLRLWTIMIFILMAGISWLLDFFKYTLAMFARKLRFAFSFTPYKRIRTKRRVKNVTI